MAEPTDAQKMAAAQAALAAMDPPRTEEDIAPNTLEAVVAVVWSQLALVPQAAARDSMPLFFEMVRPPTPALEAKVKKYNADGVALAQEMPRGDPKERKR